MLDNLWTSVVHVAGGWDWSTIAAFAAVAVTMWLARSSTRAGHRQLRQAAVIDLNEQTVAWMTEATIILDNIDGYLAGRVAQSAIGPAASDRMSAATGRLDRSLKVAHMVIPDFKMLAALTSAEAQEVAFIQLFKNPAPTSPEDERRALTRLVTEGRAIVREFEAGAGPLVLRGFKLYRLRRGLVFGARRRLASHRARRSDDASPRVDAAGQRDVPHGSE